MRTMKQAVIVKFEIATRIVVDTDSARDDRTIAEIAARKILGSPEDYIHPDNLSSVSKDEECPYDPEWDNDSE